MDERTLGYLSAAFGSSRIASSAYQKWPTLNAPCFSPQASNHSLYLTKPLRSSYPEGNFGGNQLLDGSISLSPLYPDSTNDLHVSIATSLHQSFLWLHPTQA
uniref:Uncharacterized protein n=1 Tax=Emiliania huxleyi (strain CCMP1516) TaxID=280463 RepID=A0A0D3JBH5_EMIH1